MVRHSYIVCAEELEGLNIYDVLLVDSDFKVEWHALRGVRKAIDKTDKNAKHHFFTISNGERMFKLVSESDKKMMQFIESIRSMRDATPWSQKHRFDSFAPVRHNVHCQWLVDGVNLPKFPTYSSATTFGTLAKQFSKLEMSFTFMSTSLGSDADGKLVAKSRIVSASTSGQRPEMATGPSPPKKSPRRR